MDNQATNKYNTEEKISFRELINSRFDDPDSGLAADEVAMHGCVSGFPGLTYYKDTCELYDIHGDEIFELCQEYAEDMGWQSALDLFAGYSPSKSYVTTNDVFKNAMVWQAVEILAHDYCEREHQEMKEMIQKDAAGGDKHAKEILGEV